MPTQVVDIELSAAPARVHLRDDVSDLFVVVTDQGRPVQLMRVPRPAGTTLQPHDIVRTRPSAGSPLTPAPDVRGVAPVSIVIPTRERAEDLARCLESLQPALRGGHEVVVVDNAPKTKATAEVAERFDVRRVVEPTPGINNARNAGVAAASYDVVAFIDDDAVASDGWLNAIAGRFQDPSVGGVTGLVLPLELETDAQEQFERYCRSRRDLDAHVYSRTTLAPSAAGVIGMGANMAFRRRLVIELGWFDPRLGTGTSTRGGDENDMFARILDAGWSMVYAPEAYVWHRHRRTAREVRSCVFGYGIGVFSMLTKRLVEHRDVGAIVTAGRWFVGPVVKAARAKMSGEPSPAWSVVLAETAGAPLGPLCFAYESWKGRRKG